MVISNVCFYCCLQSWDEMMNKLICPFLVTSPWVKYLSIRTCMRLQMSNGGDYWGSKIRESIWLSYDYRRPIPLPASHQGDIHKHTHIQDPDNDIGYLQYVCEYILYVCEGQTAPPFTSWQMTQPSRCNWHTRSHTNGLQVCLSCYQKVWQVETDKMDGWIEEKKSERVAEEHRIWRALSTLKSKDKTYSVHWVCEYLYILRWYRSHQNILLVDTSTSRATAFFRVGTTCTYSFFSRSMRRISWRLVNIRYGLFPDGEVNDVHAMIMYKRIPEDHIPQFMYDLTFERLDGEATKLRRWVETLDWY